MSSYEILPYPEKSQLLVMFHGSRKYYDAIRRSLNVDCSRLFEEQYRGYRWAFYVNYVAEAEVSALTLLLRYLKKVVFIDDALSYSFALDYYHIPYPEGGGRSRAGELIYQAKYCKRTEVVEDIVEAMTEFFESVPVYMKADYLISVPHRKATADVPQRTQQALCERLDIADGNPFIAKIRETGKIKNIVERGDKAQAVRGAFAVTGAHPFDGKRVVIIDDVYDHGITLHEVATTLQNAGASVASLVVAKTISNRSYKSN